MEDYVNKALGHAAMNKAIGHYLILKELVSKLEGLPDYDEIYAAFMKVETQLKYMLLEEMKNEETK